MQTRIIIAILLIIFVLPAANAQNYERAVGCRLGSVPGLFYDIQNEDLSNTRFMITSREKGNQLTVFKYFKKYKLEKLPDYLYFYYGYGAHAGFISWNQGITDEKGYYWSNRSAPVIGLDGLIGIAYELDYLPLAISIDAKPGFDFWGPRVFRMMPFDFSLGAIYHF